MVSLDLEGLDGHCPVYAAAGGGPNGYRCLRCLNGLPKLDSGRPPSAEESLLSLSRMGDIVRKDYEDWCRILHDLHRFVGERSKVNVSRAGRVQVLANCETLLYLRLEQQPGLGHKRAVESYGSVIGVARDHEMISSPAGCWTFTIRVSIVWREVAQGSIGVRTCKTMDRQTRAGPAW